MTRTRLRGIAGVVRRDTKGEMQGVGQGQAAANGTAIHAKGSGTWRKMRGQARTVC